MSLNLGAATAALNALFASFQPQQWKRDLFYGRLNNEADALSPVERGQPIQYPDLPDALPIPSPNTQNVEDYKSGVYKSFSNIRGILAIDGEVFDKSKALYFQFNPENISDSKTVEYADRQKPGFDNADYIWSKGGGRTLSFELMLDASLSSNTPDIITSNGSTHDPKRGTLNQVEFLQSLVRPYFDIKAGNKTSPLFSKNGATPTRDRFANPPQVAFSYGPIYLQGVVTDLGIEHEAFNRNLAPIRTKANISFRVREDLSVEEATAFSNKFSVGAVAYEPKTLQDPSNATV